MHNIPIDNNIVQQFIGFLCTYFILLGNELIIIINPIYD